MLFADGTVAKNVGFMVELGHDVQEGGAAVERGFVTFNNLGSHNLAHLRVGKFDPNTFSSYATVRQQLGDVGESQKSSCVAGAFTPGSPGSPCSFNRPGLSPSAFATKFYGLYDRSGNYLSPSPPRSLTQGPKPAPIFTGVRSATGSSIRSGW